MSGKGDSNDSKPNDNRSGTAGGSRRKDDNTLGQAVKDRDVDAARIAIKGGADVNRVDDNGWSCLRKACRHGDLLMVQLLLEQGADISCQEQVAVITASSWGRDDVLYELLEAKANVGPESEWDISPLRIASQHGHLKCIKTLLDFGADINKIDRQNCDPITTAWENNRSEIVLFLVENGANLNSAEDWSMLVNSPSTALMVTQGIARRNERRIREDEERGVATVETYSAGVTIPMVAFCKMIENVPHAATVLFDQVLLKTPKDAPHRGDLRGAQHKTEYLMCNTWIPKEEPRLLQLAPKDMGNGTAISIRVFHHEKVFNHDVIFHLTRASEELFLCHGIQSILLHAWNAVVKQRFFFDLIIEILGLLSLFILAFVSNHYYTKRTCPKKSEVGKYPSFEDILEKCPEELSEMSDTFLILSSICIVFITVFILHELGDELRQISYFKSNGRAGSYCTSFMSSTGASIGRWVRMLFGLVIIITIIIQQFWDKEYFHLNENWDWYKPPLALYLIMRWGHLLTFLRGCSWSGTGIIPILNCYRYVGPFLVLSLILIVSLVHSIENFGHKMYRKPSIGKNVAHEWITKSFIDKALLVYNQGFLKKYSIDKEFATAMYIDLVAHDGHHIEYAVCGNEFFGKGCYRRYDRQGNLIKIHDTETFDDEKKFPKNKGYPAVDHVRLNDQKELPLGIPPRHVLFVSPKTNRVHEFERKHCKAEAEKSKDYKEAPNSKYYNPGFDSKKVYDKTTVMPKRWFDYYAGSVSPTSINNLPACINQPFRNMEIFWFIFSALLFSVSLSNAFVAVLGEAFDFEQEKAKIHFYQERCHLCFRYMLASANSELCLFSAFDNFLTKCLKVMPSIPENGYLWTAYVIDEDESAAEEATAGIGKLGNIKHSTVHSMGRVIHRTMETIEDIELRVGRDFDNSIQELKNCRRDIMKSLKNLGNIVQEGEGEEGEAAGMTKENLAKLNDDEASASENNNESQISA